jgi:hypothetical protein
MDTMLHILSGQAVYYGWQQKAIKPVKRPEGYWRARRLKLKPLPDPPMPTPDEWAPLLAVDVDVAVNDWANQWRKNWGRKGNAWVRLK